MISDPEELLTQVSDDDKQILGPVKRKAVHGNPALIHRSVHVLVFSRRGELLLQKRSPLKDIQPGKWDTSVGGHVGWGQSYEEAARRETAEELGIAIGEIGFLHDSQIRNPIESENIRTYWMMHEGPFAFDRDEIDEVRFWTRVEIEAELGQGTFTSNFETEFEIFTRSEQARLLK